VTSLFYKNISEKKKDAGKKFVDKIKKKNYFAKEKGPS